MATETVYTTGKSTTNARINIGSGAFASADGQIAFPDECSSIKLIGAGSHPDGQGTLLIIDSNGVIKKAGGAKTTIASVGSDPATPTTYGTVYGQTVTDGNVILGSNAAPGIISDITNDNTAIGREALFTAQVGTNANTAIGAFALYDLTTGNGNVSVGRNSAAGLTTGTNNVFLGQGSSTSVPGCVQSIALGTGSIVSADYQLAISDAITHIKCTNLDTAADGAGTLLSIDSNGMIRRTGGNKATVNALSALATPSTIGFISGYSSGGAAASTAVGESALILATGTHNQAFGYNVLAACTTGNSNTAMGAHSMLNNISGSYNAAFGRNTLVNCTVDNNTAVGSFASVSVTTGTSNTACGMYAGEVLTTGSQNTFIGYRARPDIATASGRIAIGYMALVKEDNECAIAPTITQWRSEGLLSHSNNVPIPLSIDSAGIIKKSPGLIAWGARINGGSYSLTTGSSIRNLVTWTTELGNSAYLTSGQTFTVPAIAPTGGLWQIHLYVYVTNPANLNNLNLSLLRNSVIISTWEQAASTTAFTSRGGSLMVKLNPGDTLNVQFGYSVSSNVSLGINAIGTYFQAALLSPTSY
ncbi:Hypothetical protein PACV_15 [Pacmanvirus A23]|uniref:virion structural protein n=1 Tax=Pacmanvirus A23 TaxID=1932881 RepID=UPI000A0938F4|nr:virion structural protein [Pacmanvirus A23]SIP85732.1 Hypothetical protein PACV_15 [Pacmanvirus A23]